MEPMKGWYVEDLSHVREKSPALEYDMVVTKGGAAEVIVEAVPAFPLKASQQLRCAISIGDGEPQWITFEMGNPDGQPWTDNVAGKPYDWNGSAGPGSRYVPLEVVGKQILPSMLIKS